MDLATLTSALSDECNKGNSLTDATIQQRIRMAMDNIERSRDWFYMRSFDNITLDPNAVNPRRIDQPARLRAVHFVRIARDDGSYVGLDEVDPKDITKNNMDIPKGYWRDGTQYWWLDNTPDKAYTLEYGVEQYTEWSSDDAFEPWLLAHASDLMLHQTMILLATYLREPEIMQMHKPLRDEAAQTLREVDDEMKYSNHPLRMGFGHE